MRCVLLPGRKVIVVDVESSLVFETGLRHCPVCGMMTWFTCEKELAKMLEEELKPKVQLRRFVVVKRPTEGIVEQHNSPDMKASP